MLERQLRGRPSALDGGRAASATPARRPRCWPGSPPTASSPLRPTWRSVEPALAVALNSPETARSAAAALGELPDPDAQRSLVDLVLDPSRPAGPAERGRRPARPSIRRFGPLLTADQEARLAASLDEETDPGVRAGLAAVLAALSPVQRPAGSVRPRTARIHAGARRQPWPSPQPGGQQHRPDPPRRTLIP